MFITSYRLYIIIESISLVIIFIMIYQKKKKEEPKKRKVQTK